MGFCKKIETSETDEINSIASQLSAEQSTRASADTALSNRCTALENANTYASTEHLIGTFLGKSLYRKVVDAGNLTFSSNKATFTFGTYNTMVKLYGICTDSEATPNRTYQLPYLTYNGTANIGLHMEESTCVIEQSPYGASRLTSFRIVFEYTK